MKHHEQHHEIRLFWKKIIGNPNVNRSSPTFTLFEKLSVQKDTLFKTVMVDLYTLFKTRDPENHTLFSGTYPYGPNKGVSPPPPSLMCKTVERNTRTRRKDVSCLLFPLLEGRGHPQRPRGR